MWLAISLRHVDASSRCSGISTRFVSGGDIEEVTPDPIPNSEVKLLGANGTAREAVWESRKPLGLIFMIQARTGKFVAAAILVALATLLCFMPRLVAALCCRVASGYGLSVESARWIGSGIAFDRVRLIASGRSLSY